jgi:hypothetical protein
MRRARRRIERRKKARKTLSRLVDNDENIIVIHYSCESFYDRPDGTSPRVTSIAVRNFESGQATSFSIHQIAEREGYSPHEIDKHYDQLEKKMLGDFYEYVRNHSTHTWLHWNMRNIDYGFQAIAHRYRVLGGEPVNVDEKRLVNLAELLVDIYGDKYIDHQRLPSLVKKNEITHTDFLPGKEEAKAFENKEYVKLHRSTLRKIEVLTKVARKAEEGTLRTNSTWQDIYGFYPQAIGEAIGEWIREHWIASILLFLFALVSFIAAFWQIL